MYKLLIVIIFAAYSSTLFPQDNVKGTDKDKYEDTEASIAQKASTLEIKEALRKEVRDRFPKSRFLDISYQYLSPSNFRTKLDKASDGKYEAKGKAKDIQNVSVALNIPLYSKNRWIVKFAGKYDYDHIAFDNLVSLSGQPLPSLSRKEDFNVFSTGISAFYILPINKIYAFNLSISGEGTEKGYQNFNGRFFSSMILRKSKTTQMSVGLVLLFVNKSKVLALPAFSYSTLFCNSWTLDIFIPAYAYIRKHISQNGRFTAGTEIGSKRLYYQPDPDNIIYMYRHNELKTVALYEQKLNEKFIFSLQSGLYKAFRSRVLHSKESHKRVYLRTKQDKGFYIQASISYLFFNN